MVYRFYEYTLDPAGRELRHGAQRLAVEPKVFQVLLYLLEHRDRVASKAELLAQCWPGTFVSESALSRCLARLRKAVQPTPTAPPVIETRHRQGYRFVAAVTVLAPAPPATPRDAAPLQTAAPLVTPVRPAPPAPAPQLPSVGLTVPQARPAAQAAERRQLTVLCCHLVDATTLAGRLDPADFRDLMRQYHAACTAVLQRYDGRVAQYLGGGLLASFGWPQAHEDAARRAVHAGLALVAEGFTRIVYRCLPYYQHTTLYPVVEWLQCVIPCDSDTSVPEQSARLEVLGRRARLDSQESVLLLVQLLRLDLSEGSYPTPQRTPQQQRQHTLELLRALVCIQAEPQPVLLRMEDLHWVDPTTLEWLGLVVDQGPTTPV